LPAQAAQFVFEGRAFIAAEDEAKRVAEAGGFLLTREDEAYPERLLEIYDPPAVLWIRGDATVLARPGIAVVGTRQPSPYGLGMAEMLSRDLANRRLTILSGMARGVDSAAHKGALDAGGKTVAVWGTGIDVVYPKENKRLAERIVESGGTIVSEYPLGTAELSHSQPDSERDERRRPGGRGRRVFRHAHHRALRHGAKSRRVCRAGQRDQQERLGA
jgi:DNA processing protein